MPIRCVLFDFDGVIADTEERNADYLASALAHFGVRLTEEDRSALVGINDPSLLEALLKRRNAGHSGAATGRTHTPRQLLRKRCRPAHHSPVCGSFSLRFAHRAFVPA